jgi:Large polyvalent protein associated domain 22
MDDFPVTLDFSKAIPLPIVPSTVEQRARALQAAVFYASQQDPEQYARLLRIQELTGIPPEVSKGNEKQIQQMLDARRIDPQAFTAVAPRTAVWASNPDNAAVAGVDEIQRFGGIEQDAATMRAAAMHGATQSYALTATNPQTQHEIGTNDGGQTWYDVQTGEKVQ